VDWDTALAAFAQYLEVERAYSPRTIEVYTRDVAALRAHLREKRDKDVPLARLSAIDIRSQLAALFGVNGAATIGRKLSSVRAFCRFLVKRGAIPGNPAAAVRGPKKKRGLPRALDVDDAFRLVEAPATTGRTSHRTLSSAEEARHALLRLRDAALLELLYGTGLRVSEACGLDLDDIDRDRYNTPMLLVRRGKGNKSRQVPVGGAADRALAEYLPARRALGATDRGALFVNAAGERLTPRSVQRDAPPRRRCRPARDPGAARSREPRVDADLYEGVPRPPDEGLRRSTPAREATLTAPRWRISRVDTRGARSHVAPRANRRCGEFVISRACGDRSSSRNRRAAAVSR
jgi:integrase/recombinase XerC